MDTIKPFIKPGMTRISWTRAQADRASRYLVYIFWIHKNGKKEAVYVGRSSVGISRPLDPSHAQASIARGECHEIEFIICVTAAETDALERQLIYNLQPRLNKMGKRAKKQLRPRFVPKPLDPNPWTEPILPTAKPWSE